MNVNILQKKKYFQSDQSGIIEQAKFTNSPLGKAFGKQKKTIEEQGKNKQMLLQNETKDWSL